MFHVKHLQWGISMQEMIFLGNCPLCEGSKLDFQHNSLDYLVSKNAFSVYKCMDCGLLYTNPRPKPESIQAYYQSSDYLSHSNKSDNLFSRCYRVIRRIMLSYKVGVLRKHLNSNGLPVRILDYGCGTGEFLLKAKELKYDVVGFEPSEIASKQVKEKGLRVMVNDMDLDKQEDNSLDAITLWHVMEHIHDIKSRIKVFSRILRNNGLLVIAIPENKSFDAAYYKTDWAGWDLPRHLFHFDEITLKRLVGSDEFTLLKRHPLIFDSYYISLLSERFRKSRLGILRAIAIGFISNLLGLIGKYPYSSQIYVFRKNTRNAF
jgi:SAM-dependent methyltransferase